MRVHTAFIVRPFGLKDGFDFDSVERDLIRPALERLRERHHVQVVGGTTGEIVKQGSIRPDMFRLLVTSDLVIADVSIHNANVFYELGIRHGLQERHTVLLRAEVDDRNRYPFDLQSERYFLYDRAQPGASVDKLVETLRTSLADTGKDSPVFQLLPKLRPPSRAELMPAPSDFQDEVELAAHTRDFGKLRLLAHELEGMEWRAEGLRLVGNAQFKLKANHGARATFEALRETDPRDLLANQRLATIYQRLSKGAAGAEKARLLTLSDQAVERALEVARTPADRAEAYALLGSNRKTRWIDECSAAPASGLKEEALRSAYLGRALEAYLAAMRQQLDRHYPAINALALLRCQVALAGAVPSIWQAHYDDPLDAERDLRHRKRTADRIAALLELALARDPVLGKPVEPDEWAVCSVAELLLLTRPEMIENARVAYRDALSTAELFTVEATRRDLELFRHLGLFEPNTSAALEEIAKLHPAAEPPPPERVVLFTGHMVDRPGRATPRFPRTPEAEAVARRLIEEALAKEAQDGPVSLGIAGGACGGDILFHEVCAAAGIPHQLMLALPPEQFQVTSVQHGNRRWVERYAKLRSELQPSVLQDSESLPRWLADRRDYDIWQRTNLWMMFTGLTYQAPHVTLMALYNPDLDPDGRGGARHLRREAQHYHFKLVELDARELVK